MQAAQLAVSMLWFQGEDAISSGNAKLLMIFIGIVALGSLTQAIVVIVMAMGAAKTQKRVEGLLTELHGKAMPLIQSTQTIVTDLTPKIKVIAENVTEMSHVVRNKAQEIDVTLTHANETVREANARTRAQVERVDGMVSSALTATSEVANTIHRSIRIPVREVAGMVTGLKAGLDVLVGRVQGFGVGTRYPKPAGVLRTTESSPLRESAVTNDVSVTAENYPPPRYSVNR